MELLRQTFQEWSDLYDKVWEKRDTRVDDYPLMSSPLPTIILCLSYVYIVKVWGPAFMKDRKPYDIKNFLLVYNLAQSVFSTYIFIGLLNAGWGGDYSWRCQPVDYSNSPKALKMVNLCWLYYFSKFTEFIDTFCFIARKKFEHVSLLHVVHHGIMPLSVWPGARFVPGGHASFFGFLNVFVHMFMYLYYFLSALGPQYRKYIWWKQHMTTLQMIQFIGIMTHGFQLVFYDDCDFPWQFAYYIAAHAVMFFGLFSQFYIKEYLSPSKPKKVTKNGLNGTATSNGHQNGISSEKNGLNGEKKKEM